MILAQKQKELEIIVKQNEAESKREVCVWCVCMYACEYLYMLCVCLCCSVYVCESKYVVYVCICMCVNVCM